MVSIKIDLKDLARLKEIPKRLSNMKPLMDEIGEYMVSSTQRKIKEGIQPENSPLTRAWKKGGLALRDTGRLMSSIDHKADAQSVTIGTNVLYGRLQQLGGKIVPKKANKLYIPDGWKTRQMMRKFGLTPGKCIEGMKKAGYGVWRSKSGKAMMAAEKGKKGKPFVLFILKNSVEIPKRRFLNIDSLDRKVISQKVDSWLNQNIRAV